jgi:hypothetical protein
MKTKKALGGRLGLLGSFSALLFFTASLHHHQQQQIASETVEKRASETSGNRTGKGGTVSHLSPPAREATFAFILAATWNSTGGNAHRSETPPQTRTTAAAEITEQI